MLSGARLRHALPALLLLCLPPILATSLHAGENAEGPTDKVKAAYLLRFPPFVTWHQLLPSSAFEICVVGRDPFGALLRQEAASQREWPKQVVVRHLPVARAASGCREMFVTGSDRQSVADALAVVRGSPVLTVTDDQTDPAARGIINFVPADGRVRFEIDLAAAATNGLAISSKLLSIAVHVHGHVQ